MTTRTASPETIDHDTVMSWLQDREMKDHKLGAARSGRASVVSIATAIGRLQEKAYVAFPHIERDVIDAFVRAYVDPRNLAPARPQG